MLPPPHPDRENIAAEPRPPGAGQQSVRRRPSQPPSLQTDSWIKVNERTHLEPACVANEPARHLDGILERVAIHDVETQQLLLGLRERPVEHQRLPPPRP